MNIVTLERPELLVNVENRNVWLTGKNEWEEVGSLISGVGTICEICGKKKKLAGRDLFLPLTTIESQDLGHRKKIENQEEIQIFQEKSKILQKEKYFKNKSKIFQEEV